MKAAFRGLTLIGMVAIFAGCYIYKIFRAQDEQVQIMLSELQSLPLPQATTEFQGTKIANNGTEGHVAKEFETSLNPSFLVEFYDREFGNRGWTILHGSQNFKSERYCRKDILAELEMYRSERKTLSYRISFNAGSEATRVCE